MKTNITGIRAASKKSFSTFQTLRPVGAVELEPQPENEYDPFCVGVYYTNEGTRIHLGYLAGNKQGGKYIGSEVQKHVIDSGITSAGIVDYAYTETDGDTWNCEHKGSLQTVTIEIDIPEPNSGRAIGGKYQRVTDFIAYFSPYGKTGGLIKWAFSQGESYEAYEKGLNQAAKDGKAMHSCIEAYLGGDRSDGVLEGLPAGWEKFAEKYSLDPCYMEERFFDNTLMVTGQPDFVGYCNDELMVLDWKSSKKPSLKHKLQLAIYAKNSHWDGETPKAAMVVCFGAENNQQFSVSKINSAQIESIYEGMKCLRACMTACGVWISKYWEGE